MSTWIGLDVGGANLKMADLMGAATTIPFALWRQPKELAHALRQLLEGTPRDASLAVTMTGELCDCFADKRDGVSQIVAAVEEVGGGRPVLYYQTSGQWVQARQAREDWRLTAASNWHVLARYIARYLPGESGIMVDIGSTTTDVIPIAGGQPLTSSIADWDRMQAGELVYTGVERTPVSGILPTLTLDQATAVVPLAQELFATMLDVYLVLGELRETDSTSHTADGRPADRLHAQRRLARLCCADVDEVGESCIERLAEQAAAAQQSLIVQALRQVAQRRIELAGQWLVSGAGAWLAARLIREIYPRSSIQSLSELVSPNVCRAAPAWAAAHLAWETAHSPPSIPQPKRQVAP